ncbi:hypothetical protein QQ045_020335 [Rhodiola kirilowii]
MIARSVWRQRFYEIEIEEGRVIKFLMGLNESFAHIRTHILALRELPSIDVAYDMVDTSEAERNIAKGACIKALAMASAMYVPYQGSNNVHKQQFQSQQYVQ